MTIKNGNHAVSIIGIGDKLSGIKPVDRTYQITMYPKIINDEGITGKDFMFSTNFLSSYVRLLRDSHLRILPSTTFSSISFIKQVG